MKCKNCETRDVEQEREHYATPVCFSCLPPPKPMPVRCVAPMTCHCNKCINERAA